MSKDRFKSSILKCQMLYGGEIPDSFLQICTSLNNIPLLAKDLTFCESACSELQLREHCREEGVHMQMMFFETPGGICR